MAPIYLIAAAGRTPVAAATATEAAKVITRATHRGRPPYELYAINEKLSRGECMLLMRAIVGAPSMNAYLVQCRLPLFGRNDKVDCNIIQRLARAPASDTDDIPPYAG